LRTVQIRRITDGTKVFITYKYMMEVATNNKTLVSSFFDACFQKRSYENLRKLQRYALAILQEEKIRLQNT
jgi:hypothetical protein